MRVFAVLAGVMILGAAGCGVAWLAFGLPSSTGSAASADGARPTPTWGDALAGCGLTASTPGVSSSASGRILMLDSEDGRRPSGIDANDARCVLAALRIPAAEHRLLESSAVLGGTQTVAWPGVSATWTFRDTAHLRLAVYRLP